ncbi:ABC transporter ATP-binding protein [Natronosalvus vescus]|uniref:ABC transporter ATP-binding protein n=1 Tax=Natronosalvus vescus TaxID=2953881 RepID=UPI0020906215|nr:ABC transporter ATP-binding protein [Natronosalvus vescus]
MTPNTSTEATTEPSEAILEASDIEHAYGSVDVLDGVSLGVPAGEMTALIGPNGSGKTTLLRIMARLLRPSAGRLQYRGPDVARDIGYLPQQPSFRPGFTVRRTLTFYAELVGADADVAMTHLEHVGLEAAADRNVEALSGGMTRLLGIAQATIGDPPVVVLDEPASGLDPGMRAHVFDVANELTASGQAVLVSSHDLELVDRHADTVALLDDGGLVQTGAPASIVDELEVTSLLEAYEASVVGEAGTVRVRGEST